jgi:hypothetical protein
MKQISGSIAFFLLGFIVLIVVCNYTYNRTRQALCDKFSEAFDKAIALELDKRTKGIDMYFSINYANSSASADANHFTLETEKGTSTYEKKDEDQTFSDAEKITNATQSYLLAKNPVRVSLLDSMFCSELEKQGIVDPAIVSYTNHITNLTQYSKIVHDTTDHRAGISYYALAYPTERRTQGLLDEITLQGFVKVSLATILRDAPLTLIFSLTGGIMLAVLLIYTLIARKRKTSVLPAETESAEEISATLADSHAEFFRLDANKRALICPEKKAIMLSEDMFRLFEYLWNCENRYASYENISSYLYGNVDINIGKKRIMQIVKSLRNRFKGRNVMLTIENTSHRGYRIVLGELNVENAPLPECITATSGLNSEASPEPLHAM